MWQKYFPLHHRLQKWMNSDGEKKGKGKAKKIIDLWLLHKKTFTNIKNEREKAFFVQKFKSLIISVPGFLVSYFQSFVLAFQRTTFKELYVVQKLTTAGNSMIAFKALLLLFQIVLSEIHFKASQSEWTILTLLIQKKFMLWRFLCN